MATWDPVARARDDDPYHAWIYDREAAGVTRPDDGQNGVRPERLCAVVIEVQIGQEDRASLIENLKRLARQIDSPEFPDDPKFYISHHERRHLEASTEEIENDGDKPLRDSDEAPVPARIDYARLYLVHAEESELFPRTEGAGAYWAQPHFTILYVGPAQKNIVDDCDLLARKTETASEFGAVLVVIDDSFAFLNQDFVKEDGTSLFREIWLQGVPSTGADGTPYNSSRIENTAINRALAGVSNASEFEIYSSPITSMKRQFVPLDLTTEDHQPLGFAQSHGTHVASTACRDYFDGAGDKPLALYGIAVPTHVTAETSGATLGAYLLPAIRQAMMWADVAGQCDAGGPGNFPPLVINLSYGFPAGPKDGSSPLNRIIGRMIDGRNDLGRITKMVVAMGNGYNDRGVARTHLAPGERLDLDWVVQPDDRTPSYMEIFAASVDSEDPAEFLLTLTPPDPGLPPIRARRIAADGEVNLHLTDGGERLACVGSWKPGPSSRWSARAFLGLAPSFALGDGSGVVPSGRWKLEIVNASRAEIELRAFVQRDDQPGTYHVIARQSYLDDPHAHEFDAATGNYDGIGDCSHLTKRFTSSVFTCIDSPHVYAAGSGMDGTGDVEPSVPHLPSPYAASGPRLPGKPGPECSAVSDRSWAFPGIYRAATNSGTDRAMNGSSVAAPRLSGQLLAHLAAEHAPAAAPSKPTRNLIPSPERFGPDIPHFLQQI
ncbi:MAG: S8 family serine peptidase [Rhodobacter sp.]|nr:S8 family serine peptidase [Rhodobacter sp.]